MKSLHLATAALEGLGSSSSEQTNSSPQDGEVGQLLIGYQRLLELADRISPTLLIRNNSWLVQVKGLRQHYLYENQDFLTEIRTQSRAALEIGKRDSEKSAITALFTITVSDKGYQIKSEQNSAKALIVPLEEPNVVSKLMSYIK